MAALIRKFCEAKKYEHPSVTCWGTGTPEREFMHVDDLAEAVIFCLERWNPNHSDSPRNKYGDPLNFLNVGTGKTLKVTTSGNKKHIPYR